MVVFTKTFTKILVAFSIIALLLSSYILYDSTKPLYNGPVSDHFDGKRFHNYTTDEGEFSLMDFVKWQYYEFKDDLKKLWPKFIDDVPKDLKPDLSIKSGNVKITFINHATFLIQTEHLNILTDPLFAKRASPLSWIGPKRYRNPGIALSDLPKIDYIVISHDHYDHCDIKAIKELQSKYGSKVIAGLGMKNLLASSNIEVTELDWWQQIEARQYIKINFVPAVHWSGRYGLMGNNRTLWGGFVIETPKGNIYFAGDTALGQGEVFQMIKERYKNFEFAMIPIGAYEPRWFMKNHHVNPEEAVQIHKILMPKKSIAFHFGCFALSREGEGTPEEELRSSIRKNKIPSEAFLILKHGDNILFDSYNNYILAVN